MLSTTRPSSFTRPGELYSLFIGAWLPGAVFYFRKYALRSISGVMVPKLTSAWNLSALGLSSLVGLYYYTNAGPSINSGASLDHYGARYSIPFGIICLAVGAALFGLNHVGEAQAGRRLQGAGSAFAFIGAVYLAANGFSARLLATALGAIHMFGMLGGADGQFVVSPLIHGNASWQHFWLAAGAITFLLVATTFVVTPTEADRTKAGRETFGKMFAVYKIVLIGLCAGLLFLPATIGDMIWGVSMLQNGSGVGHTEAVNRAAMLPLGWVFGAPSLAHPQDYQRANYIKILRDYDGANVPKAGVTAVGARSPEIFQ